MSMQKLRKPMREAETVIEADLTANPRAQSLWR
jgi:hypothetical protein